MRLTALVWNESNIEHLARHGVRPQEATEIAFSSPHVRRARGRRRGRRRYYVMGETAAGRYLLLVVEALGQGQAQVVTGRDMEPHERRLYTLHRR